MGGSTALELALEHPDRVRALVLIAPGLDGHAWSEEMGALDAREEEAFARGDVDAVVDLNVRTWVVGHGALPWMWLHPFVTWRGR